MLSSLCVLKVRRSDSENENRLFFFHSCSNEKNYENYFSVMKKNVMKKKSNICFDYEPELLLVDINENLLSLQLKKRTEKEKSN